MWAYLTIFRLAFFPSSSSSSLWKSKVNRNYITASVGMSGTTTDRKQQTGELSKLPVCSQGIFFFFTPPSLPRPRRECRRGMKKKKKTHSEADTQELQHTKHRLHVCQVTLCSQRASAPQECTGKQAECALGLSCF